MKNTNNNTTVNIEEKEAARARRNAELAAQMDDTFYYFGDLDMCIVGYPTEAEARKAAEETFEENMLMGIDLKAPLQEKAGAEATGNA